jgi:hypothetical protein
MSRLEDRAALIAALVNGDAEQRVIGAALIDNKNFHRVAGLVCSADFGNALHARIFDAIGERVALGKLAAQHYGGDIEFLRLAVTPAQARQYRLPSAPPKETDRRRFEGNETWQIEALDPRELANIVRIAIEGRFDRVAYQHVLEDEIKARQDVLSRLSGSDASNNGHQ